MGTSYLKSLINICLENAHFGAVVDDREKIKTTFIFSNGMEFEGNILPRDMSFEEEISSIVLSK